MSFNNPFVPLFLLVVLIAGVIFVPRLLRWLGRQEDDVLDEFSDAAPRPPIPRVPVLDESLSPERRFNSNLIYGAILMFVLSSILGFIAHSIALGVGVPNNLPFYIAAFVPFWALGIIYYFAALHTVQTGHRGVVSLFGKRYRWGEDNKGLKEGANFLPLPRPLMTVKDEKIKEQIVTFKNIGDYTTDEAQVMTDGAYNWSLIDPYYADSIDQLTPAINAVVFQAVRDIVATHVSRKEDEEGNILPGGLIKEQKELLSDVIRNRVNEVLRRNAADPNRPTLITSDVVVITQVNIEEVRLPKDVDTAINKRNVERIERQGERIQVESRLQQIEKLKAAGVDPSMAYTGALADAGKSGVNIVHLSVDKDITEAIAKMEGGAGGDMMASFIRMMAAQAGGGENPKGARSTKK